MLLRKPRCWLLLLVLSLAACDRAPVAPTALVPTATVAAPRATIAATVSPVVSAVASGGSATPASPVVERGGGDAAIPCGDPMFGALIVRFLDAFDRGDQEALATFFTEQHADLGISQPGEEMLFHWYSVSDYFHRYSANGSDQVYARTRAAALAYFAMRHAQHEQFHLLGGAASAGQEIKLVRQADDLPTYDVTGKVEFACPGGTIVVWSMGPDQRNGTATPR